MRKTIEFRVTGRVQGVGFRYFVFTEASRLQLNGWVRNEWDGSVSGLAEGPDELLQIFCSLLQKGPSMAWVERLFVSESIQEAGDGFRISH
jgi:acylphosphatase